MADSKKPKSGAGCFSKLLFLILLAAMGGLGAAVFFVAQAQDLTDVGGYGPSAKPSQQRDLALVLKNAIKGNYAVTLTEAELNPWLARTLVMKQGGVFAANMKLEHFWIRLEEGRAELIMERLILGRPFTVSMYFQIEKVQSGKEIITNFNPAGGPFLAAYEFPVKGGRFGKLVVPQGFLHLVMPAYSKIAALYTAEIDLAFKQMARVSIQNDRLVLDPREPLGEQGMPMSF